MAARNITLVYGGGRVGVMGLLADTVLKNGGKVTGIIPQFLMDKEVGHTGLTELHVVKNMHERKQLMNDLSDGVITLPGGLGTLEEFFEVLTWLMLGIHNHPVGLLNINGFFDHLLAQMDLMVEQRFLKPGNRDLLLTSTDPIDLIYQMETTPPKPEHVWFKDKDLT